MQTNIEGEQLSISGLDSWYGRMSLEHSQVTEEKTFKSSSPKLRGSQSRTLPLFLYLSGGGYGKWPKAGALMGTGPDGRFSIAWRVFDAQFWGTPQRRKRIALVADFGGLAAPEILFERKGVSGDIDSGEQEGEETPRRTGERPKVASALSFVERAGKPGGGQRDINAI